MFVTLTSRLVILPAFSRDIQVGVPLTDIVESVLESKAKEILPKIVDAVESLSVSQVKETAVKKDPDPPPPKTLQSNPTPNPSELTKSDFVDLSLPIDIPGLRSPAPLSGGITNSCKKDNQNTVDSKQNKSKQKGTSDTTVVKDSTKDGNKNKNTSNPKTQSATSVGKDGGKVKSEQSGKEKEKPKVYKIPKKTAKVDKSKKDLVDSETVANPNDEQPKTDKDDTELISKSQSSTLKEKAKRVEPSEEPGSQTPPTVLKRSARLASLTENKEVDSVSDDDQETVRAADITATSFLRKKRPKVSVNVASKKAKVMISSSSEDSENEEDEVSSEGYESDTDQQSEELPKEDMSKKVKRKRNYDMDVEVQSIKKSKLQSIDSSRVKATSSKQTDTPIPLSPTIVVTRYNRSVKPNRRYYEKPVGVNLEEDLNSPEPNEKEKTDQTQTLRQSETTKRRKLLDTTRPCDIDADLEIYDGALTESDDGDETKYGMLNPKPVPLKIKKTQAKALRSRQKTKTRVNFFWHQ